MRFQTLLAVAAALSTAACVSVLPDPDTPDALYRIGPMSPDYALGADLVVRQPEAPALMGGRAIASVDKDGAIRLLRGVEWAESATRMLQLGLLDALSPGPGGAALAPGAGGGAGLELSWRVSDFALHGDQARCRMELTLLDLSAVDGAPVQTEIAASIAVEGGRADDRASALAEAGRACVRAAAGFVSDQSGGGAAGAGAEIVLGE